MVEEIDRYRAGQSSATTLLNNLWGLITAAEVDRAAEGEHVRELYVAASSADDARHAAIPLEHRGTDADFEEALDRLRAWATDPVTSTRHG